MQPIRIESILNSTLKDYGLFEGYKKHKALILWERVCGSMAAEISRAKDMKGDKLFVTVRDHIWASEMALMEYEYIKKYDKLLGKGVVNKIYFKADPTEFTLKKKGETKEDAYEIEGIELSSEETGKIESILAEITDEKTRELAKKILTGAVKFERWLLNHGGQKCFHCGVVVEKNMIFCPICLRELERKNIVRLWDELNRKPWLSFAEAILSINPLSYSLYLDIKSALIEEIEEKIVLALKKERARRKKAKSDKKRHRDGFKQTEADREQTYIGDEYVPPHSEQKNDGNEQALQSSDQASLCAKDIKLEIITLAMLRSGKKPSELTDDVLRQNLTREMYEFYKDANG